SLYITLYAASSSYYICDILTPSLFTLPLRVLLLRRLPPSPLFPYTTLFRSLCQPLGNVYRRRAMLHLVGQQPVDGRPRRRPAAEDRKSTRLNSSHVKISYAVFCLEKKKAWRV